DGEHLVVIADDLAQRGHHLRPPCIRRHFVLAGALTVAVSVSAPVSVSVSVPVSVPVSVSVRPRLSRSPPLFGLARNMRQRACARAHRLTHRCDGVHWPAVLVAARRRPACSSMVQSPWNTTRSRERTGLSSCGGSSPCRGTARATRTATAGDRPLLMS